MKYSREKLGTLKEIEHLQPEVVRVRTKSKKLKGWVNFRLSRQITWSWNKYTGEERLWLNARSGFHAYAELYETDLDHLMYNILLIIQFRSQIGAKKVTFVDRKHIRIPKNVYKNAIRAINKYLGLSKRAKNRMMKRLNSLKSKRKSDY